MPVVPFKHNLIKVGKRQYQNPIFLARGWQSLLDRGECSSPAALSRYLQVSRARVTQILNLLKLVPEVIEMISSLEDPLESSFISERRLRPFLKLNTEKKAKKSESCYQGKAKHIFISNTVMIFHASLKIIVAIVP